MKRTYNNVPPQTPTGPTSLSSTLQRGDSIMSQLAQLKRESNEKYRLRFCVTCSAQSQDKFNLNVKVSIPDENKTSKIILELDNNNQSEKVNDFAIDVYGELYSLNAKKLEQHQAFFRNDTPRFITDILHILSLAGLYNKPENKGTLNNRITGYYGAFIVSVEAPYKLHPQTLSQVIDFLKRIKAEQYAKDGASTFPDHKQTDSGLEMYIPSANDVAAVKANKDKIEKDIESAGRAEYRKGACNLL